MTKNVRNAFLFVLTVLLMSGCVRYAIPLYPDEALAPSQGYVYGRFSVEQGWFGTERMGVVLTSADKKREIALKFEPSSDPQVVAVDPGDYQVTHMVYTRYVQNDKAGSRPFPEALVRRVIHVEAGKAYYIGDFDGSTKNTFLVFFEVSEWRLGNITNNFAGTTAKLDALFPRLGNLPKVDVFGEALVSAFSNSAAPAAKH